MINSSTLRKFGFVIIFVLGVATGMLGFWLITTEFR
jgi:hypothetical protein